MQTIYGFDKKDILFDRALKTVNGYSNTRLHMLESVLKEELKVKHRVWNLEPINGEGNIDHQSNAGGDENVEMFDSKDSLKQFLFAPDSVIHEDNDNY